MNDKKITILNIVLLVINLVLIGFNCYKIFTTNVSDSNVVNNSKNESTTTNNSSSVYSFNSVDEINDIIYKMNYGLIYNINNYDNFTDALRSYYLFEEIIPNVELNLISEVKSTAVGSEHQDDKTDSNGNTYPEYSNGSPQFLAKDFGLTVLQIEEIDEEYWPSGFGGLYNFKLYDTNVIKEKYPVYYDELFSSSFNAGTYYYSSSSNGSITYDKKLDMIIYSAGFGGTATGTNCEIVDANEKDNEYIVEVAYAFFTASMDEDGTYYYMTKENDSDSQKLESYIKGVTLEKEYIKKHADKLNKYEVKFVKENGKWFFSSISN